MDSRLPSRHRGFTLIEMILVIGLAGGILVSAATFTFGLMHLKTEAEAAPQETEHIANVRRFLEFAFSEAQPIENIGESGAEPDGSVAWVNLPGSSNLNEFTLAFRLSGENPIFMADQLYIPAVDCYLRFLPDEGLYLYWQTDAMADEDTDDLRRTLISPLVTKIEYLWYDQEDEKWDISEELEENDEGANVTPDFIRLTFAGDKENPPIALLLLPPSDEGVPRL